MLLTGGIISEVSEVVEQKFGNASKHYAVEARLTWSPKQCLKCYNLLAGRTVALDVLRFSMTNQYTGFRVELTSSQLGKIVGVVSNVSEKKISLINAVINNYPPTIPSFAVESRFIQNIRILSTASDGESSGSDTPVKVANKSSNSSREQRREWLRNIPNACSVYVCPDSPPIIHRTTGAPGNNSNVCGDNNNNDSGHSNDIQLLDNALAKASICEPSNFSPARKYGVSNHRHSKQRNYSISETAGTASDISGTESDSFHRYTNSGPRGQFSCGGGSGGSSNNRYAQSRGHSRSNINHNHSHRGGGNSGLNGGSGNCSVQRNLADWDQIRVEEFIDEDFDFEGNLALFNKSAFYEMVDLREGHSSITYNSDMNNSSCPPRFVEGPDGVGIPLFAAPTQSSVSMKTATMTAPTRPTMTITSADNHHEGVNKKGKSIVQSTSSSCNKPSSIQSVVPSVGKTLPQEDDSNVIVNKPCHINPIKRNNTSWWYTCTGQRVPICQVEQRQRLLCYLATGLDLDIQTETNILIPATTTRSKFQGLTWNRLIESATRPLIDNIMLHLRQLNKTPQRILHRPPARILIIPNGSNHLGAILSLNVARYLSTLGACVLLVTPLSSIHTEMGSTNHVGDDEYPMDNSSMSAVYRNELHLLMSLAPKPNQYGLDNDEDESENYDDQDEEESEVDDEDKNNDDVKKNKQLPGLYMVNNPLHRSTGYNTNDNNASIITSVSSSDQNEQQNDADFDNMSYCGLNYADINIVDHSSVGRIWMSRMPGVKVIRRPSCITKLPSSIRIDLVIIGHSDNSITTVNNDNSPNTNSLFNWLRNHNSIGGIIHLTPSQSIVDSNLLKNAQQFVWLIELGLPILTPQSCHSTVLPSATTRFIPSSTSTPTEVTSSTLTATTPLTHLLIDIGLGRNIVRKLTGDLNLLPPYGLFDLGSITTLRSGQQSNPLQQISR
ncbi:DFDF motif [Schistosoma japonicum]|uniref:DFDF motif n=1 Tax=Schistosoma japonicum TaxID=6182 RepID=A0A4Z2D7B0_SCHJA|nr:DFDF motif [Schistosoma japonicum]